MTNYERIKKMSVEEMANFLYKTGDCSCCSAVYGNCFNEDCDKGVKIWLESEVEIEIELTEVERMILENLGEGYSYIARDRDGSLSVYFGKPSKGGDKWNSRGFIFNSFRCFSHLFQFIKWEDEEAYDIYELLKEG